MHAWIDEGVPLISDGLVMEFNRKIILQPILFMGMTGIVPIQGQIPVGEATGVDIPGAVWERFHTVYCRDYEIVVDLIIQKRRAAL